MATTRKEILKLHFNSQAISGIVYTDEDDAKYVGLSDGSILHVPNLDGEIDGDGKNTLVNNIGTYSHDLIISTLDLVETKANSSDVASHISIFNQHVIDADCKAITYAIVFG